MKINRTFTSQYLIIGSIPPVQLNSATIVGLMTFNAPKDHLHSPLSQHGNLHTILKDTFSYRAVNMLTHYRHRCNSLYKLT